MRRCTSMRAAPVPDRKSNSDRLSLFMVLQICAALNTASSLQAADSNGSLFRLFNFASPSASNSTPHPAVVRVLVEEGKAQACGSGSLIGARDQYGLVVTNWHVIREARGKIEVVFPGGFRSAATVLKSDEVWDLAALLVWRSKVTPLTISNRAPQPGDTLTIAGYGQGDYRAISGKCTQYVAPSDKHPFEIVELSAQARQGDSGGPILNDRGELAGVLFGANRGSTTGSYCVRVRSFLAPIWPDLDSTNSMPEVRTPLVGFDPSNHLPAESPVDTPIQTPLISVDPAPSMTGETQMTMPIDQPEEPVTVANTPPPPQATRSSGAPDWNALFGDSNWDRAKTVFAIIGLLTVWGHVARMMTK